MSGDSFDYAYGQKKVWRKWCWNRVCEKLGPHRKDKTVLYLAGSGDYDRREALQRGFKNNNLIAIDLSNKNISHVRRSGGLGVQEDLYNVLMVWPHDWRIDVLIADFCQGLSDCSAQLIHGIFNCPAIDNKTILWINMMRGRDAKSNEDRKKWAEILLRWSWSMTGNVKHRGELWFWIMYGEATRRLAEQWGQEKAEKYVHKYTNALVNHCQPQFTSYRSESNQFFDTIIYRNPFRLDTSTGNHHEYKRYKELIAAKHKISALRAIRTMAGGSYA